MISLQHTAKLHNRCVSSGERQTWIRLFTDLCCRTLGKDLFMDHKSLQVPFLTGSMTSSCVASASNPDDPVIGRICSLCMCLKFPEMSTVAAVWPCMHVEPVSATRPNMKPDPGMNVLMPTPAWRNVSAEPQSCSVCCLYHHCNPGCMSFVMNRMQLSFKA